MIYEYINFFFWKSNLGAVYFLLLIPWSWKNYSNTGHSGRCPPPPYRMYIISHVQYFNFNWILARANAVVFDHLSKITLFWVTYQYQGQIIQVHFEGWLWPTYRYHRYQHCSLCWGQGHCQVYNCKCSSIRPVAWELDHLVYWRHYGLFWKITSIINKTFFSPPCLNSLPYLMSSFV